MLIGFETFDSCHHGTTLALGHVLTGVMKIQIYEMIRILLIRFCLYYNLWFAGFADVVAGQFERGLLVGMLSYIFVIEFILKVLLFLELNNIP